MFDIGHRGLFPVSRLARFFKRLCPYKSSIQKTGPI